MAVLIVGEGGAAEDGDVEVVRILDGIVNDRNCGLGGSREGRRRARDLGVGRGADSDIVGVAGGLEVAVGGSNRNGAKIRSGDGEAHSATGLDRRWADGGNVGAGCGRGDGSGTGATGGHAAEGSGEVVTPLALRGLARGDTATARCTAAIVDLKL